MVAAFLLLAMASHVTRMQTMVVVAQMREGRRRELLVQLLMSSNMPLTTQTRRKVERSPNGWRSSTMYGYVYGKDGVRNSDSVFKSNFRIHERAHVRPAVREAAHQCRVRRFSQEVGTNGPRGKIQWQGARAVRVPHSDLPLLVRPRSH